MNTLERQNLTIGMVVGGGLGFFLGTFASIALNWGVGAVLAAIAVSTLLGAGVGAWVGRFVNRRFPPMLPFHAREHKRLREVVNQARAQLQRMTGVRDSYPELDAALRQDASLRVQASELRLQMDAKARSALSWGDYLAAAQETLREGGWRELFAIIADALKGGLGHSGEDESGTQGSPRYAEWVWGAYRSKLRRELSQIQRKQARSDRALEQEALRHALDQKERELESFDAFERTLRALESASAAIAVRLETLHMETIRLTAQPQDAPARVEALLQPLRQQVEAYEQATREVRSLSDAADG